MYKHVKKFYKELGVKPFTKSFVDHDGIDRRTGSPKSNLYDLFAWYEKDGKYCVDIWHTEEWNDPDEVVEYHLYQQFTMGKKGFESSRDLDTRSSTSVRYKFKDDLECKEVYNIYNPTRIVRK